MLYHHQLGATNFWLHICTICTTKHAHNINHILCYHFIIDNIHLLSFSLNNPHANKIPLSIYVCGSQHVVLIICTIYAFHYMHIYPYIKCLVLKYSHELHHRDLTAGVKKYIAWIRSKRIFVLFNFIIIVNWITL